MKLLIDAHLPRRMVRWLTDAGCDAIHTLDLPQGNRTSDRELSEFADREERILVTKDADFVNSHLLSRQPTKLLLVTTGNISNRQLEQLVAPVVAQIVAEFENHFFLELGPSGVTIRG